MISRFGFLISFLILFFMNACSTIGSYSDSEKPTYSDSDKAENWELATEEHSIKYFLNSEIKLASLNGENVAKIQNKIVYPSGLFMITTRYWRHHGNGWEAATKTIDSFEANGRLQSHQEWEDSKVVWTATDPPKLKAWVALLDKATVILQAKKQ